MQSMDKGPPAKKRMQVGAVNSSQNVLVRLDNQKRGHMSLKPRGTERNSNSMPKISSADNATKQDLHPSALELQSVAIARNQILDSQS